MLRYRDFLRNRDFLLYNAGQALSQFADRLVQIAILGMVYKINPGSSLELAKAIFFTVVPAFLISPIAGVYVDRFRKRNVMLVSDVVRSGLVFLMPLALIGENMPLLYAILFLIFTAACFFLPAKLSTIPDLVEEERLLMANSAATTVWAASGIFGFTAGAFIIELIGLRKGIYMTGALYLTSAFLISFISGKRAGDGGAQKPAPAGLPLMRPSFFRELKDGLKLILTQRSAQFIAAIFFVLMSVVGSLYVVAVIFIQDITGSMTSSIGVFGLFLGIGALIGAYFFGKFAGKIPKAVSIPFSFVLSGLLVIAFAAGLKITRDIPLAAALSLLTGIAASPIIISGNTLVHETVDEKIRGRIFSSLGIIMNAGFLAFMFLSSYTAEKIGRVWIIIVCGMALFLCGTAMFAIKNRMKKA